MRSFIIHAPRQIGLEGPG